jgi:hypothetical protein
MFEVYMLLISQPQPTEYCDGIYYYNTQTTQYRRTAIVRLPDPTSSLNLRSTPWGRVIGFIPDGTLVNVYDEYNGVDLYDEYGGFALIDTGSCQGWVLRRYLY